MLFVEIFVPLVVFLALLIIGWYFFKRHRSPYAYNPVKHQLDDEEIEFKRILDDRSRRDDIDELFDVGGDDIEFNLKDKDRLKMLEKYRDNLMASARNGGLRDDGNDDIRL